jgi:hypothetical protein
MYGEAQNEFSKAKGICSIYSLYELFLQEYCIQSE